MKLLRNIRTLNKILWEHNKLYYVFSLLCIITMCGFHLVQVIGPRELLRALESLKFEQSYVVAIGMYILLFLLNLISLWAGYKKYVCGAELSVILSRRLAESALSYPYEYFEEFSFRKQYSFAESCIKKGSVDAIMGAVVSVIGGLFSFVSLLYVVHFVSWWLWILIAVSILINILCEMYRAKYDYKSYENYSMIDRRMVYTRDTLSWKEFAKECRIFHMYDYIDSVAKHYISLLAKLQKKRAKKTFFTYFISCIFDFVQKIAVFGYVVYQCYIGELSVADFSMVTLAIISISKLSIDMAKEFVKIGEIAMYVGAYMDMIEVVGDLSEKQILDVRKEESFSIVFQNVNFAYPGTDKLVLENISFEFQSGKKYGLVGANGSGKTTFVNLLMGLYTPVSGKILFNGNDVTDFTKESWSKLFSAVLQDFNTYAYTVSDNVSMLMHEKQKVKDSLAKARIDWLNENDYVTSEYEQGKELSGGEAQKLAIARAIFKDSRIFVFDEPTAALSPQSEHELYENICKEMQNKMLFFISHRLASCQMCDEILVFNNGKIIEKGNHDELMKRQGMYETMFRAQACLYDTKVKR